tara:strand:- start:676 stop:1011 length:336 start_codon:yes stop_codon:yes gene_type:complete
MPTSGTVPLKWLNLSCEEKSSRGGNKDTLTLIFQSPCLRRGFLFDHQNQIQQLLQRSMEGSMTEKERLVEQVFAKYRSYCKDIGITPAEMMQQAYLSHLKSLTTEQLKAKL